MDSPSKKMKSSMELVQIPEDGIAPMAADPVDFARSYQIEALEQALEKNTIVFLETGAGKTLVAIMLLRSYSYLLKKPSRFIAVFLVPNVVLVAQQAKAVTMLTDLKVGTYWGEMGVDYWDAPIWKKEQETNEVLVMTPMILLNALRHSFLSLEDIKVLIFDECHNARGKHPYACIMTEFYHCQKGSNEDNVPRVFGMTASPVKSKASGSSSSYLQHISELENLMNSKIYTVTDESVLAAYIPFSTTKLKLYNHLNLPYDIYESAARALTSLKSEHESSLSNLQESTAYSTRKKLSKLHSSLMYCMEELGVWLALKAAETLAREDTDIFSWGKLDVCCETVIRDFSLDAFKVFSSYMPSVPSWSIGVDMKADLDAGYLSSKVICLIESLLGFENMKDLRSIIFVERVITAVVLPKLLNVLFPKLTGWNSKYTAGHSSGLQSQSRTQQNQIVEEFRRGMVNIIVATSILEEGLDVQSCNLVIRFDPPPTVCSFIQSRGRARMEKSVFLNMVKSEDTSTITRMRDYIVSVQIMRAEALRHASQPCSSYESKMLDDFYYRVESTGAVVTLNSSIALVYFYCSRLPSDGYFKPSPRVKLDKILGTCTLIFPKNCPIGTVTVEGNKMLKQLTCLEACKQLHKIGALTDNLVPYEEAEPQESGFSPYSDEQDIYFPPELVSHCANDSTKSYHFYLIELVRNFEYDIQVHPIFLAVRTELGFKDENIGFELEVDRGNISVQLKYVGEQMLTIQQVHLCQRFQTTLLRVLLDHDLKKLMEVMTSEQSRPDGVAEYDYLVLPSNSKGSPSAVDWACVCSVLFPCESFRKEYLNFCRCKNSRCQVNTKNGVQCRRMLEDSLVYTPHNGHLYVIDGTYDNLDGNSLLILRNGEEITYKEFYKLRYDIDLCFKGESLLRGKRIFPVRNCLLRSRKHKEREARNSFVELPPELCFTVMSPISMATVYSFSFVPSIMHRIESLVMAINLRKMHLDLCTKKFVIPATKVLEAITTKKCHEKFHLESLETLGDSFLKYATCQQLFKTHQSHHEGLLSIKKDKIVSNKALCKLGCDRKLPGFIRNEPFEPKTWVIPGDHSRDYILNEEILSSTVKVYNKGNRTIKSKTVADVVEALIGAFLSTGGETAALIFMDWLGIKVDFICTPYERHFPIQPEKHVNIKSLEALLGYSFRDPSLLVEALTHGSYMLPEIPRCYQRLEFLGDAVLDYLITRNLYCKYPWLSPGLMTDLRSASVNNDCYAQSALRAGLHKHVLHASQDLHRHIVEAARHFEESESEMTTFGWESESSLPKVLGDIIESLAGAILVDSGYNKDILFPIMKRLLEPMITPETMRLHPVRELTELCMKENYELKKSIVSFEKRVASITVEVEANGESYIHTCTAKDKKTAKKLASKAVLASLKEAMSARQ